MGRAEIRPLASLWWHPSAKVLCGDGKGFVQCPAFEQDISFCSASHCLQKLVTFVSLLRGSSACAVLWSQLTVAVNGSLKGGAALGDWAVTWHWPPLVAGKTVQGSFWTSIFLTKLINFSICISCSFLKFYHHRRNCQIIPVLPTGCGISFTTVTRRR